MKYLERLIDSIRKPIKRGLELIARLLHTVSRGKISPNALTFIGLAMHVPIAILIASNQHRILAAILLVIFGLFDSLDGSLARLQNKASNAGMLLDASTDRIKEVLLYTGVAFAFSRSHLTYHTPWIVAAVGVSIIVSYIKAKGEMAAKNSPLTPNELNRLFQDGIMRFEVRMAILVLGLLTNQLLAAIIVITIGGSITMIERLILITNKLR